MLPPLLSTALLKHASTRDVNPAAAYEQDPPTARNAGPSIAAAALAGSNAATNAYGS